MQRPIRIQLSRKSGWRKPENTLVCARPARWSNPYRVEMFGRELAINLFERSLRGFWSSDGIPDGLIETAYEANMSFRARFKFHPLEYVRSELSGRNLACWCSLSEKCHVDVLLRIAADTLKLP